MWVMAVQLLSYFQLLNKHRNIAKICRIPNFIAIRPFVLLCKALHRQTMHKCLFKNTFLKSRGTSTKHSISIFDSSHIFLCTRYVMREIDIINDKFLYIKFILNVLPPPPPPRLPLFQSFSSYRFETK